MLKNKRDRWWTVVGILTLVVVVYLLARHFKFITMVLNKSGPWAPIVALILYPILAATPISSDPLTIVMGVTYGPFPGVLIAWAGNMMGVMVEYYLGTKIGETKNFKKDTKRLPFGLGKLPVDAPAFLIFGRMIPGFGSKVISLLAGAHKVRLRRYLWTSALTNFLGAMLLAYGGLGLINLIKQIFTSLDIF